MYFISAPGQQSLTGLIQPGKSVGEVSLESSLASFQTVFAKNPGTDEELPLNSCGVSGYHWVDVNLDATGVYAYLRDREIVQIAVKTPRFALPNGLKVEASEQDVKRRYPNGKGFVLLHSGSAAVGGRDLIYWVDEHDGVAFELYWNARKASRFVSGIFIFEKQTEFLPEGCISVPQEWKALR